MKKNIINLLYLTPEESDVTLIQSILANENDLNITIEWSKTIDEYNKRLETEGIDLILASDNIDGISIDKIVESTKKDLPHVPFFIISYEMDKTHLEKLIKLGITDYFSKDHLDKFLLSIQRTIQESKTRTAYQKSEDELEKKLPL